MEIVLLRHGKLNLPQEGKYDANEFKCFMDKYDNTGIDKTFRPSQRACEKANDCHVIVCSDLPRAIESALALNVSCKLRVDSVFRETKLPCWNLGSIKLSAQAWGLLFRSLWFMGYSGGNEALKEAKLRAAICSRRLSDLAKKYGSVMLVGHGMINFFIAKILLADGWSGPRIPSRRYWDFSVYKYD